MNVLTEITNTIIGSCLLLLLLMLANYLASKKEYQQLTIATANLLGTINYSIDQTLRKLWSTVYQLEDKLTGYKTPTVNYF
jgi:hypothetical protein